MLGALCQSLLSLLPQMSADSKLSINCKIFVKNNNHSAYTTILFK